MAFINPTGTKLRLMGSILKKRNKGNNGDLSSLLLDQANAKLLEQLAKAPTKGPRRASSTQFAIADRYESSASRSRVGSQNAQNGIHRASTADAALKNANDIVGRMSELSAMASDPTLNDSDRASLDAEAQALKQELSDLESNTSYNGQKILQGSSTTTFTGESTVNSTDANLGGVNADLAAIDLSTQAGANAALSSIDTATTKLSSERVKVGATSNQLSRASDMAQTRANNLDEAASTIRESELGPVGSLFGAELGPIVNEMLGFS